MLKKVILVIGAAAMLGSFGYSAMAYRMVAQADTSTLLIFSTSERLPLLPRVIANWHVNTWEDCPSTDRDLNSLGMTLRSYGMDGFDNDRVLATATHLIELGCAIDRRSPTGHTAMHEAILYNEPAVVSFLLNNGADPAVTIEVPDQEPSASRRYFSGMSSIQFTEELQQKSALTEDRGKILALLKTNRG